MSASRTNNAVGDSIVDVANLQWEKYPRFHNLTNDEIATLTVKEFDAHEFRRMEMNAWCVSKELANRIDGDPVFNEYTHAFVTEKPSDAFFSNRENLREVNRKSVNVHEEVPGYAIRITNFIQLHYRIGGALHGKGRAAFLVQRDQIDWPWIGKDS